MFAINRRRALRKVRPSTVSRIRRLLMEQLEDRTLLATVSWAVDADGFWDVGSNWSTSAVPTPGDDVVIDRPVGAFTITHRTGTTAINSLITTEQIVLSGGTLSATDPIQIANSFRLQGGTLQNSTITAIGGSKLIGSASGGVLNGVILNGDLDLSVHAAAVTIQNGLELNGTANLNANFARLDFPNSQTLSGNGTVVLGNVDYPTLWVTTAGGVLTLGPGITVRGGKNGSSGIRHNVDAFGGSTNVSVINHGTIAADVAGRTLRVQGTSFTNDGELQSIALDRSKVVLLAGQ